jgi:hypothetical protein
MRPAVLVFAPLLLLPLLACDRALTEPDPDAAVTGLQQPPSAEPLFDEGPNGPGCGVIADGCGATERNGNGPNDAGPTAADASTADEDPVTEGEGGEYQNTTRKKAQAKKPN